MNNYIKTIAAIFAVSLFSCSPQRSENSATDTDNSEMESDSIYEEMQGDTLDADRSTGTFGSPGSGYGTENESGTGAAGTSTPAGDAASDTESD